MKSIFILKLQCQDLQNFLSRILKIFVSLGCNILRFLRLKVFDKANIIRSWYYIQKIKIKCLFLCARGNSNNTWHSWEGGRGTGQCHQMTQGGGRGFAEVSRDIFFQTFWALYLHFVLFSNVSWALFLENTGGVYVQMSQNYTESPEENPVLGLKHVVK